MQFLKHQSSSNHSLIADLYQQYAPALFLFICRQVPTREDAEDVLLEVFQAAFESDTLINLDASKQKAWLWSVARNKATDFYRRTRCRPQLSATLEELEGVLYADDRHAPETVVLHREAYAELRTHLSSLSELQQEVLRLRFAQGLRCSEIAQRLNKSSAAIRIMLSRSLNLLRNGYKQRGEDTRHG